MTKTVLLATQKPFAPAARDTVVKILSGAGYSVKILENYQDRAALISAVSEADALIVRSDKVDCEVIQAAPKLKIVVRAGAGYDNVDCRTAKKKGVVVMNTPGQNANAVAELAVGMMLMAARNNFSGKSGTEIRGKTLGLLGFGNVARRVGQIARGGFDMKIIAYDPFVKAEEISAAGVEPVESLEKLYRRSDYLSLHIPALPETRGTVNHDLLDLMKDQAVVINTARAELINEDDLLRIYREKPGFRFVSDIAPGNKDEIVTCDGQRCFFTPKKMGAQTAEANFNAGAAAARQIIAFFEKGDTSFQVNP